ncbi:MAG: hypothetical protein KatS3mg060_1797 [Dehalococcoidia bacterium]|jgi:membrane protease YdiL (CAAX protease family)|nr:MAG: hypothetical protein KatS3mg060_1797 [Dehalococcoidia bacterium]
MDSEGFHPAVPLGGALVLLLVQLVIAPIAAFVLIAPLFTLLAGVPSVAFNRGAGLGLVSIVGGLLTIGALWVFARRWPAPREALALVPGRLPWWVAPPAVLGLAIAIDMVTAFAGRPIIPEQLAPLFSGGVDSLLLAIAIVAAAPPVEELVYRGALYGALEARWGVRLAFGVTTVLFALVHVGTYGADLWALGQLLLLGGLLTWLRAASGSLVPSLIGHGVANAYATALILLTR